MFTKSKNTSPSGIATDSANRQTCGNPSHRGNLRIRNFSARVGIGKKRISNDEVEKEVTVPLIGRRGELLGLPDELLELIVSFIPDPRDQIAVCSTCHALHAFVANSPRTNNEIGVKFRELSAKVKMWIQKKDVEKLRANDQNKRRILKEFLRKRKATVSKSEKFEHLSQYSKTEFVRIEKLFIDPWFVEYFKNIKTNSRGIFSYSKSKDYEFLGKLAEEIYLEGIERTMGILNAGLDQLIYSVGISVDPELIIISLSCRLVIFDNDNECVSKLRQALSGIKLLLANFNDKQQEAFFKLVCSLSAHHEERRYYCLLALRNLLFARVDQSVSKVQDFEIRVMECMQTIAYSAECSDKLKETYLSIESKFRF